VARKPSISTSKSKDPDLPPRVTELPKEASQINLLQQQKRKERKQRMLTLDWHISQE